MSLTLCFGMQLNAQQALYAGKQVESGTVRIKISNTSAVIQKMEQAYEQGVIGKRDLTLKSNLQPVEISGLDELNSLNITYNAVQMTRIFRPAGKFEERHEKFGLNLWYELKYDSSSDLKEILNDYSNLSYVQLANPKYQTQQVGTLTGGADDPRYEDQWHYNNTGQNSGTVDADIDLPEAWEIETGNANVVVAIHDGGIDTDHEDLVGNLWVNSGEIADNGIDDDDNGYIDDVHGYNFADDEGEIEADEHGTHVAGTVGAETNNGIGVSGVAGGSGSDDGVRLMSCQIFSTSSSDGFAEGFTYAADNGAVISQNSWGYTSADVYDQSILDAIDYFIANAGGSDAALDGGIAIFAAGNDGEEGDYYPGYYSPTLAVAAVNDDDELSYYSTYGTWVDISAPGGEQSYESDPKGILSTLPDDSYDYYQGTSMACPHVSGVAALVVSNNYGELTADELREILVNNVDDISANNTDYEGKMGSGRVNAYSALLNESVGDEGEDEEEDEEEEGDTSTFALELTIVFDNYPEETSWEITDDSGDVVESGGTYSSQSDGSTLVVDIDLDEGCYEFTIEDTYGDGMYSSRYGNGSYELYYGDELLASGGDFDSSETTSFCLEAVSESSELASIGQTSLTEDATDGLVNIYPNPCGDLLKINVCSDDEASYKLIGVAGKIVCNDVVGEGDNEIDCSSLAKGVYVLQVTVGDEIETIKIIKE